jgi:hypothetical protein
MDELFGFERPARGYSPKIVEEGEYFEDERIGEEPDSKGTGVERVEVAR